LGTVRNGTTGLGSRLGGADRGVNDQQVAEAQFAPDGRLGEVGATPGNRTRGAVALDRIDGERRPEMAPADLPCRLPDQPQVMI
jgi:hypothetical protein